MKKLIVLAAAALLAAGANAAYKDGSYTGEGQGKSGPVKVQVTVKAGKIGNPPGNRRSPARSAHR